MLVSHRRNPLRDFIALGSTLIDSAPALPNETHTFRWATEVRNNGDEFAHGDDLDD